MRRSTCLKTFAPVRRLDIAEVGRASKRPPYTAKEAKMLTSSTLETPLSPHWAFVAQLREGTALARQGLHGRIEHIVSSQATDLPTAPRSSAPFGARAGAGNAASHPIMNRGPCWAGERMPPGYRTIRRTPYADRHMMPSKVEGGETGAQAVATPACPGTTLYDLIAAIQDVVGPEDGRTGSGHGGAPPRRSRQLTRMSIRGCAQVPAGIFLLKSHRPDSGQGGGERGTAGRPRRTRDSGGRGAAR